MGAIALLVMLAVYSLIALAVAVVLQVNQASNFTELAYYAIAGLLWVIPAAAIIYWMARANDNDR